ncbi:MAG: hypothetical protein ACOY0T_10170 [Myxococcota bacterium]
MKRWSLLPLGLGLLACGGSLPLSAPPQADAPFQDRVLAYRGLRPLSLHETHVTYVSGSIPVGATRRTDYLQLANGRRVYDPADLLPAVEANSPTGVAIRENQSLRENGRLFGGIGLGCVALGTGVMFYPVADQLANPNESFKTTPLLIGGGLLLAGTILVLIATGHYADANDAKATAFETFDGSLQQRLNVCVDNNRLVPCNQPR